MDQAEIPELLTRLQSEEDATRKMAVFKLQASINDPSIADIFISSGGLQILRQLIMTTSGNTLAYALAALSRLLEVEMGWEIFESNGAGALIERVVELIVTHPLVNILRGAMSILVAVVSHSQSSKKSSKVSSAYGFRALKPAIALHPQFFEMVVSQLKSADHLLCANSLMLLNALIRDSVCKKGSSKNKPGKSNEMAEEWPNFVQTLQDLGIVQAAYDLMQSSSLQDMTHSLLEFQTVSKVLLKKRKDTGVNPANPEHQRMLEEIYWLSQEGGKEAPLKRKESESFSSEIKEEIKKLGYAKEKEENNKSAPETEEESKKFGPKGKQENKIPDSKKWQDLGFQTDNPIKEFEQTGFLGLMDLAHFVAKDRDSFHRSLQEQVERPINERCPIAKASLLVTEILCEYFEIDRSDSEDPKANLSLDGIKNHDSLFRPFILQWSRIHVKALNSFIRLWMQTKAEQDDFGKVAELLRILIDKVLGGALRTKDIQEIEEELTDFDFHQLRELQMEVLNMTFEDEWGQHLSQIRDELRNEALQFMKEQRIRTLLQGTWFPLNDGASDETEIRNGQTHSPSWRYVKLSHNRRYLHFGDFHCKTSKDPLLSALNERIDLGTISSVVSNVSATENNASSISSPNTEHTFRVQDSQTNMRITIKGHVPDIQSHDTDKSNVKTTERTILTLAPSNHSLASAWLDGLLMILNQVPITSETKKLIDLICDYGLKIRLLNVRLDDLMESPEGAGVVPSRDGLNDDYFYEI